MIVDRGPPPAQAELGRGTPIVGDRALLGIRVSPPFAPVPAFIDTGTSLVDKGNVDGYLSDA